MSNGIHSCGYHCERPACIKAQRNHLYAQNERLRDAARMALEFCEFCWRDVSLNDYAEERRSAVENALRAALGSGND